MKNKLKILIILTTFLGNFLVGDIAIALDTIEENKD